MNEGIEVGKQVASGQYSQSWILAIVLILIIAGMGYLIFKGIQIFFSDFSKKLFDRMDKFEATVETLVSDRKVKEVEDKFNKEALQEFKTATNDRLNKIESQIQNAK